MRKSKVLLSVIFLLFIFVSCASVSKKKSTEQESIETSDAIEESISLENAKNLEDVESPEEIEKINQGIITKVDSVQVEKKEDAEPVKRNITTASFIAVGDNLIHESIYKQANMRVNYKGYNFEPAYSNILPFVYFADFAFINQETLILPSQYKPSTYPRFGSPAELGDFLVKSGFNMFSIANNHMLDKEEQGLFDSIKYWEAKTEETGNKIVVSGGFKNEEDLYKVRLIERNGITLSLIAFTTTLNGLRLPPKSILKLLLDTNEKEIKALIEESKKQSDLVIVSAHWGEEYKTQPNEKQKEYAQKLADWGADVIIGTHPHVLQPIEEIKAADGRNVLVAYSLGNFISAQNQGNRLIGGMLSFNIEKDLDTGKTEIYNIALTPLITQYETGFKNISVYHLGLYSPNQARNHGVKKYTASFNYNYILNNTKKIIDEKYLKLPEFLFTFAQARNLIWLMR